MNEKFKKFINEESDSKDEFKIEALLVINNEVGQMKSDILSGIRAIEGITRVNVDIADRRQYFEVSKVTIKINIAPFQMMPIEQIFSKIRSDILSIQGVRRFTYIGRPVRLV